MLSRDDYAMVATIGIVFLLLCDLFRAGYTFVAFGCGAFGVVLVASGTFLYLRSVFAE